MSKRTIQKNKGSKLCQPTFYFFFCSLLILSSRKTGQDSFNHSTSICPTIPQNDVTKGICGSQPQFAMPQASHRFLGMCLICIIALLHFNIPTIMCHGLNFLLNLATFVASFSYSHFCTKLHFALVLASYKLNMLSRNLQVRHYSFKYCAVS